MESARGEVEAEGAMNGQTDLTSTGQTDGVAEQKRKGKKDNKKVIRARRPTSEGESGRESPWWKVVVHHGSQISRPENIFKYNRNSNTRRSPNVGDCHYPDLSLYQLVGIKVSAPDWGEKVAIQNRKEEKNSPLHTRHILGIHDSRMLWQPRRCARLHSQSQSYEISQWGKHKVAVIKKKGINCKCSFVRCLTLEPWCPPVVVREER